MLCSGGLGLAEHQGQNGHSVYHCSLLQQPGQISRPLSHESREAMDTISSTVKTQGVVHTTHYLINVPYFLSWFSACWFSFFQLTQSVDTGSQTLVCKACLPQHCQGGSGVGDPWLSVHPGWRPPPPSPAHARFLMPRFPIMCRNEFSITPSRDFFIEYCQFIVLPASP